MSEKTQLFQVVSRDAFSGRTVVTTHRDEAKARNELATRERGRRHLDARIAPGWSVGGAR